MKKSVFAAFTAIVAAASLAACGASSTPDATTAAAKTATEAATDTTTPAATEIKKAIIIDIISPPSCVGGSDNTIMITRTNVWYNTISASL